MGNDNSDRSSSESSSESDSDVQNVADPPLHAGRALTRTFIHLPKRIQTVPRKTAFKKLVDAGRVKDVGFRRSESASTITDSLVAAFPTLAGLDLSWWVIALNWKSNNNYCYKSGLDCLLVNLYLLITVFNSYLLYSNTCSNSQKVYVYFLSTVWDSFHRTQKDRLWKSSTWECLVATRYWIYSVGAKRKKFSCTGNVKKVSNLAFNLGKKACARGEASLAAPLKALPPARF